MISPSLRPQILFKSLLLSLLLLAMPMQSRALSKAESERAGAVLFRDKGCAYCHGAAGEGNRKGPSLTNIRKTWKAPQIADQIENGGQKMPSFKESLSNDEVQQLVDFLCAKHRPTVPAKAPAPTNPAP